MRNGFTLIEVLVAITLLAVISMLVWQASGSLLDSKERFEAEDQANQAATLALQQISQNLEVATLFAGLDFLGRSESSEQRTKSVFIGVDEGDHDKITFETLSHVRYLKDAKESEQAEVSYFLESDPEESGSFLLRKREASPPDATPEEGGVTATLLEKVVGLNFRYYNAQKGEYADTWDSTKSDNLNKLPRAVEMTLTIKDPVNDETTIKYQTTTLLEMAPGPNDF